MTEVFMIGLLYSPVDLLTFTLRHNHLVLDKLLTLHHSPQTTLVSATTKDVTDSYTEAFSFPLLSRYE